MSTLGDIRAGLAANLQASITGAQISPYLLSNSVAPVIWVRPNPDEAIGYHQAMGNGLEHWDMTVEAYVGLASDQGAQILLDDLVDAVKPAIESDKTLGGIAQDLKVENATGYAEYARPDGTSLLGCRWHVTVYMNGG